MSEKDLKQSIQDAKKKMEKASEDLNFLEAAKYRDEMFALEKVLTEKSK